MRCKFQVDHITEYATTYEYRLSPVFKAGENLAFWNSTPCGRLDLTVLKKQGRMFEVGKEYIIDITEERMGSVDPTRKEENEKTYDSDVFTVKGR